jgi:hypothetical protein
VILGVMLGVTEGVGLGLGQVCCVPVAWWLLAGPGLV